MIILQYACSTHSKQKVGEIYRFYYKQLKYYFHVPKFREQTQQNTYFYYSIGNRLIFYLF